MATTTTQLAREHMLSLYSRMFLVRRFEESTNLLFMSSEVPGTVHLYNGQEAVAVGVCSALRLDDYITSTHRPHGHAVAKGIPLRSLMAELLGRTTGCCHGKGGSMHLGDIDYGMVPAIAIVAGGIPVAAGIGLAFRRMKTDRVVACFFGDGAVNEGAFHEGVNLAAIWDLPVVFVCENNLYGASTHVSKVMKAEHVADRVSAYGIPSVIVDGMDVLAVHKATCEAVANARDGKGPTLIECKTYRLCGHSRSDPQLYRPREEMDEWRAKDPITTFRARLIDDGLATADEIDEMQQAVEAELEDAIEYARKSPHPQPEDALADVYCDSEDSECAL
jgi:acetoin:2,6-dichlorophenolindophenol oxidoreductase subunit alpha